MRKLYASEIMGGVNQVCTDKTGTLTINQMTVVTCAIEGKHVKSMSDVTDESKELFFQCATLNSSSNIMKDENGKEV